MRLIRPISHSSASFFSLLISYLMVISLCAPFALKTAVAATSSTTSKVTASASNAAKKKGPRRENQLLVRFRVDVTEQQKNALISGKGGRRTKKLKGKSRVEKFEFHQGLDIDAVAAQLRTNLAIELIEPNFLISRDQVSTPGDPRFSEWGVQAWISVSGRTDAGHPGE